MPRPRTLRELKIRTERKSQLLDITRDVRAAVEGGGGAPRSSSTCPTPPPGVTINEHADPAVARDHEMALERLVEEAWPWEHEEPHEQNAPAHVRASLMGPSVVVPLREDGSLALGTWQGIFFCELDGPRDRSVYVSVLA